MSLPLITSLLSFAIGIGIGILLQRYVISRRTHVAQLEKELDQVKGELLQQKDALQQHFQQSANLTQDLTNSYKALYEHLARGSNTFTEQPLTDLKQALSFDEESEKSV
ncbi:YhcB family protein [Bermanella sp. R86510]|uniref:YhcB family protein n=1 Tax=unclassified Bermanella TaxID=2627862 RepID=UPI0037CA0D33